MRIMRNGEKSLTKRNTNSLFLLVGAVFLGIFFLYSLIPGCDFMVFPGLLGAAWCFCYALFHRIEKKALRRVLKGLFWGLLAAGFLLFLIIQGKIWSASREDPDTDASVGIVFGAGIYEDRPSQALEVRLERALKWWQEDPERILIVTGGQGKEEICPEADVMADWLIKRGIPEEKVLKEDRSHDTNENVKYSAPILKELVSPGDRVAVISHSFHLYRCRTLVRELGYEPVGLSVPIGIWYMVPAYPIRETGSVLLMWLGL